LFVEASSPDTNANEKIAMTLSAIVAALLDAANQHDDLKDENERLHRFSEFLRRYRLGVPVKTRALGDFVRLPNRIGKIVTQEEFAEAIGVSRCWYGFLEVGRVRPSIGLMERLCDALMLDESQRIELVDLVFPVLSRSISKIIIGRSSNAA
jgi:DNA-binding XRE family transcriptional regulator